METVHTTLILSILLFTACAPVQAPEDQPLAVFSGDFNDDEARARDVGPVSVDASELLSASGWAPLDALAVPGRDSLFEIPESGYLKVELDADDAGCQRCYCETSVLLSDQTGRRLTISLAPLAAEPSESRCQTVPMASGTAVLGPLAAGRWRLVSEGHLGEVAYQPAPAL